MRSPSEKIVYVVLGKRSVAGPTRWRGGSRPGVLHPTPALAQPAPPMDRCPDGLQYEPCLAQALSLRRGTPGRPVGIEPRGAWSHGSPLLGTWPTWPCTASQAAPALEALAQLPPTCRDALAHAALVCAGATPAYCPPGCCRHPEFPSTVACCSDARPVACGQGARGVGGPSDTGRHFARGPSLQPTPGGDGGRCNALAATGPPPQASPTLEIPDPRLQRQCACRTQPGWGSRKPQPHTRIA